MPVSRQMASSTEVNPSLAGETVTLWWGLFDHELHVEHREQRFGPFGPIGAPVPLHRYRSFKKSAGDERIDRIEALAAKLGLPRAALEGGHRFHWRQWPLRQSLSPILTRSTSCASPA